MSGLPFFALTAGAAIAMQASMNARLGVLLKSSILATSIAFCVSFILTIFIVLITTNQYPSMIDIKSVPVYLWLSGVLSVFGVGMFYYLIPKMGVGNMMSYALTGQILIAIIASHFGWFDLPVKPLNTIKIIGAILLIMGILLINKVS